jgi:MoaA/NifB/PqqE/SkfB family radical SAM enzyme
VQIDSKRLAIYLTNKCNLRCKHCFIEGAPQNDDFLNWKQIQTALKHFITKDFKHIEITGGESCLSPYFFPTIKEAKARGYTVGVSTNGTNNHIFEKITPQTVDKVTFSLDGATASTNDNLRGRGVFERCLQNVKNCVSAGFRVEVVFTVHHYNIDEIPQIIKLLDDIGVNRLSFNFINNTGTANFNQDFLINPKQWIDARKTITAHSKTKKLELRYPLLFVTKSEFEQIKKDTDYRCIVADPVKIELYPDGYFYGCCFTTKSKELALGRVYEDRVDTDLAPARAYAKKYQHLSCPAVQTGLVFPANNRYVPVCVYYKFITKPQPLTLK